MATRIKGPLSLPVAQRQACSSLPAPEACPGSETLFLSISASKTKFTSIPWNFKSPLWVFLSVLGAEVQGQHESIGEAPEPGLMRQGEAVSVHTAE